MGRYGDLTRNSRFTHPIDTMLRTVQRFARPAAAAFVGTTCYATPVRCNTAVQSDWEKNAKTTSVRKAHLIYKEAAQSGDIDAIYRLAKDYLNGVGTTKDPIHAAELLQKAADKGHPRATYTLAVLYRLGIGVEKDVKLANTLIKKAADAGSVEAIGALSMSGNLHQDAKADFGRGRLSKH